MKATLTITDKRMDMFVTEGRRGSTPFLGWDHTQTTHDIGWLVRNALAYGVTTIDVAVDQANEPETTKNAPGWPKS